MPSLTCGLESNFQIKNAAAVLSHLIVVVTLYSTNLLLIQSKIRSSQFPLS